MTVSDRYTTAAEPSDRYHTEPRPSGRAEGAIQVGDIVAGPFVCRPDERREPTLEADGESGYGVGFARVVSLPETPGDYVEVQVIQGDRSSGSYKQGSLVAVPRTKVERIPMAFRLSTGRVYAANIVTETTVRREPLPNQTLSIAELREGQQLAERARLWAQLEAQGGRGIDLAERIDEIDAALEENA